MDNLTQNQDSLVFGLDIGTRNVVGVVGYMERDKFRVVGMAAKEHDTRAMLDGQIHDIYKVGDTIRYVKNVLEQQLDTKLSDVCIAAAGRVLKTVNVSSDYEFEEETRVTQEHIYSLKLLAVEKAYNQINANTGKEKFYCVGNTPVKFMLNDYDINNLEGHKANKIGVELIATFLPDEVVDGLYEAVNYAGLQVANLTLEPIAAINIAIPEQYRLLNIALIDVGAGTSDICITKDGSIVAYGMIPFAGDEITEVIAKTCLVDFNTAETIKLDSNEKEIVTYKDIMGLTQEVSSKQLRESISGVVDKIAKAAADKIKEINGGKSTNAVFVVGGGGKILGYTEKVAECLELPKERVAVRGEEVLTTVDFLVDNFIKDSLYVTPVGICTNYYSQKNSFVFINVNDQRVKLYDNNRLTVVDAVMQIGFPNEKLFPRRGKELNFKINGKSRMIRGTAGEGSVVKLNGKPANLNSKITQNDVIDVTESTVGQPAVLSIGQLEEFNSTITFVVNDKMVPCPKFAYVNGELKSEFYDIQEGDDINMENFYTVAQLFEFLDMDLTDMDIYVNNELADRETKVYENFSVALKPHFSSTVNNSDRTADDGADLSDVAATEEPVEYHKSFMPNHERFRRAMNEASGEPTDNGETEQVAFDEGGAEETQAPEQNLENDEKEDDTEKEIHIFINKEPVRLYGKKRYILVDLFDFYQFDLTRPQGNIVLNLNGEPGEYTAKLKDGDMVDLYWEKIE